MGVKNFNTLIKLLCPNAIKSITIHELQNKRVAIDGTLWLYQIVCAVRKENGDDVLNSKGEIVTLYYALYSRLMFLLSKKISPVFVFDGKPPNLKDKTIKVRKEIKKKAQEKINNNEFTSEVEKAKLVQKCSHITVQDIVTTKQLLDTMGVTYIESPEEADSQCAYLYKAGLVDYIISEDTDIIIFGGDRIIRNFRCSSNTYQLIDVEFLLKENNLNQRDIIIIAILLGCDYFPGVKGIGPKKILKMIACGELELGELENNALVTKILNYYLSPKVIQIEHIDKKQFNVEETINFLKHKVEVDDKKLSQCHKRMKFFSVK